MNPANSLSPSETKRAERREYYLRNRERFLETRRKYKLEHPDRVKSANKAWHKKNRSERLERFKLYHQDNRSKRLAYMSDWNRANKEYVKQYRDEKNDEIRLKKSAWYKNNRAKEIRRMADWARKHSRHRADYVKMRKQMARRAVPMWADHTQIAKIYASAARLSDETGIPHHVDHILPLRGRTVSGLHVQNNLRVIPAIENLTKKNRLFEEFTHDNSGGFGFSDTA